MGLVSSQKGQTHCKDTAPHHYTDKKGAPAQLEDPAARAAVEDAACSSEPPDALAAAQRGVSQCAALLRWRAEALSSCVRWWTAPHTAPPYFCESGLQAFRRMATQPSDVIMASYPKCGTSWLHQILFRCALVSLRCALKKPCAPYD